MERKKIPRPSFLDKCIHLGYIYGERRWRSPDGQRLYTWDEVHGEIEAFNRRGKHIGVLEAVMGCPIKPAVRGRTLDV